MHPLEISKKSDGVRAHPRTPSRKNTDNQNWGILVFKTRICTVTTSALKILHVGEDISSRGFFFFFRLFWWRISSIFFFFFGGLGSVMYIGVVVVQ